MTRSCDAVVIGAGLAGLCAARDLREAGHEVLLPEGRDRAGGRAWTRPLAEVGKPIELGGAWTWGAIEFSPPLAAGKAEYAARPHRNRMSKVYSSPPICPPMRWPSGPTHRCSSRFHGSLQQPEGHLFFAGADTAVCWIGWFDGALESGARAAAQASQRLGRPGRAALTTKGSR